MQGKKTLNSSENNFESSYTRAFSQNASPTKKPIPSVGENGVFQMLKSPINASFRFSKYLNRKSFSL